MNQSVIGMDIAKKVFQLHTVDRSSGRIEVIRLRREDALAFFARRQPCRWRWRRAAVPTGGLASFQGQHDYPLSSGRRPYKNLISALFSSPSRTDFGRASHKHLPLHRQKTAPRNERRLAFP